jgi:capsular exopolysaccharide synthesis family protein
MNASQAPSIVPPGTAPLGEEPSLSPASVLRAARKNWLLIVLVLCAGVAVSYVYTAGRTRVYAAAGTVQFDPQPLRPLGSRTESEQESYWTNAEYFATQRQILTSRRVAAAVVRKLGLHRDAGFLGLPPGSKATATEEQAAESLRNRLSVHPVQESRLAEVTLTDPDPARAQRVLTAVLETYVEQNLSTSLASANTTAEWLDTQLGKLKADLESQEMDLHDFKIKNNLLSVSFDDQSNMLRAQIQQLNTALTSLKANRESVAARLAVLQQVNIDDPADIPDSQLLSGTLGPLKASYSAARSELGRLLSLGKGDAHPDVAAKRTEVEATRAALLKELDNVRRGVTMDLDAAQRELGGVSGLYETAKKQALELNINDLRYTRLRRTKDSTERVFAMVLERSADSGLSKVMPFNNVRVVDRPLRPGQAVYPKPLQNMVFGGLVSLLLGLFAAVGREALDRTARSAEQIEAELGIPCLGSLPDTAGRAASRGLHAPYYGSDTRKGHSKATDKGPVDPDVPGRAELLVHTHPKSTVAEAARAIRTNVLFLAPDRPFRTLLVTSAGPSEGKTTVATSLAIAMAQAGRKVCLVDCDLRRPRVRDIFQIETSLGVTTTLLQPERLDEALFQTEVPTLSVLPAGPTPPNAADLVQSEAFRHLLASLTDRFDHVVIDSPPICVVTDAAIASTRVDATFLVVRAQRSRRDMVRRALRALRDVGSNAPGFILNAAAGAGSRYEYGYHQYYGGADDAPRT